jgi:opacity protein-like surface antigen
MAGGRPDDSTRSWFGDFSGGIAFPESHAGDVLEEDWLLSGGATYWPSDWKVGLNFGVSWAKFDLQSSAIQAINNAIAADSNNSGRIDDGDVENWAFHANAIWSPGGDSSRGLYLTGGITAAYMKGRVTETGLVYYPPICDPWYWWWCYPGGFGQGAIIRGEDSTTKWGYNLGIGVSFPAGAGQFFIEAKYTYIPTDSDNLTYVPVSFGYRW